MATMSTGALSHSKTAWKSQGKSTVKFYLIGLWSAIPAPPNTLLKQEGLHLLAFVNYEIATLPPWTHGARTCVLVPDALNICTEEQTCIKQDSVERHWFFRLLVASLHPPLEWPATHPPGLPSPHRDSASPELGESQAVVPWSESNLGTTRIGCILHVM